MLFFVSLLRAAAAVVIDVVQTGSLMIIVRGHIFVLLQVLLFYSIALGSQ